jgi:hypothetical protein
MPKETVPTRESGLEWPTRLAREEDVPFILSTWLSSYRDSPWAGVIPNNKYQDVYGEAVSQLISRGSTLTVVHSPMDENHLLGWACTEKTRKSEPVVHFVFVKPDLRRNGIATAALAKAGVDHRQHFAYTFRTRDAAYFDGGMYAPMIARRKSA